jgi:multidrug efflux system membrane fusion protein
MRIFKILEQNSYIISLLIIAVLFYWFGESALKDDVVNEVSNKVVVEKIPSVVTKDLTSTEITNSVNSYGTSEAYKTSNIRAKISGEFSDVFKKKGDSVEEGELIAKIDSSTMMAELGALKQTQKELQLKLKVSKELYDSDYSSKIDLAEIYTANKNVSAKIQKLEGLIKDTYIRSPINGDLDNFELKVGDFIGVGEKIVSVNDLTKIIMSVDIPESYQRQISEDSNAYIELPNGRTVSGKIQYISDVADSLTHTFKVEVVANISGKNYVGISASVLILTETVNAYNVSPAMLSLNPENKEDRMGLKIVNDDNIVEFLPIDILKSSQNGLWVKADRDKIKLIVSGQSFVKAGQEVFATKEVSSNE